VATIVQLVSSVAAVVVLIVAALRAHPTASYLVAVVASQLLSPVLWDHYAMLLLLPVAWLVDRGQLWAVVIPLTSTVLTIGLTPPAAYPIAFWLTLIALVWFGVRTRSESEPEGARPAGAPVVPA
jgi:hypothetical protein